jgi:hypothetical protein
MDMNRVCQIRLLCSGRYRAANSLTRQLHSMAAILPAWLTMRQRPSQSPVHPCPILATTVHGFLLPSVEFQRPRSSRRAACSSDNFLCLSPVLLRHRFGPIRRPAARRRSALLSAPLGSGFPKKNRPRKTRAATTSKAGVIFLRSLHRKRGLALGSRALRFRVP